MADDHGHAPDKKADTHSKSPKEYIVNGIYIFILLIIIFSAKSWWKEHEKKEQEKINLQTEIQIIETIPNYGPNVLYQGPTPYQFKARYPFKIRPSQCGKTILVECSNWPSPFPIRLDCNKAFKEEMIQTPDVTFGQRIVVTSLK